MRTDKQLYRLFRANPDWLFFLIGRLSPGPSKLVPLTVKALERRADGLIVPDDSAQPVTVLEVQFQRDPSIYRRTVQEMAAAEEEYPGRQVQGVILFGEPEHDPRGEPWVRVVSSFVLRPLLDNLEARQPEHPLLAVFAPLRQADATRLQRHAVQYYRQIQASDVPAAQKAALEEVLLSWLVQRLPQLTRAEILAMFIGDLPDLEETQCGKDLIALGEKRGREVGEKRGRELGEKHGMVRMIVRILEGQHGSVPEELQQLLEELSPEALQDLAPQVAQGLTLTQLKRRLARRRKSAP